MSWISGHSAVGARGEGRPTVVRHTVFLQYSYLYSILAATVRSSYSVAYTEAVIRWMDRCLAL